MPTIRERVGHTLSLSGFERYEFDHGSAPHLTVLLCFAQCCPAVGTAAAKACLFCSFRKEECCSMRIHLDKKPSDGVAIALVVITLLTPVTLAILLSRLHAVF